MTTPTMVFVDTSLCTGCKACTVACKAWNELPAEKTQLVTSYQSHKDYSYNTWTYISFHEKYEKGKMNWYMFKHQCYHCGEPSCMKACSSDAIYKTDLGFTVIDQEKCIGCGYCAANCPWGVPKTNTKVNKTYKCTGCVDRVENGIAPSCVSTCQPGALTYGNKDDMLKKAKERLAEVSKTHPKAQLYGADIMGGTNFLYLILDDPKEYDLPAKPSTPLSLILWKDIVHPLGGIAIGGAALAVTAGVLANFARGNYRSKPDDDIDPHQ